MGEHVIETLDDLRAHLQGAIALEHSTLPPYLCALYSIVPGTNEEAVEIITSVFVEEMLHLALAANLLNAVGGSPVIADAGFVPTYPTALPYSDQSFLVPLSRFSRESVATFMRIERPEEPEAPAEADQFETIGQFYRAIEEALGRLSESLGEAALFSGDPARQITPEAFRYGGSGRLVAVRDLASALEAVDEIEEQGEGLKHAEIWDGDRDMFHPDREEVAHYFRFDQLVKGRMYCRGDTPQSGPTGDEFSVDWDSVYPVRDNLRVEDFEAGTDVRAKIDAFVDLYSQMLRTLERALTGEPRRLDDAVSQMFELRDRARELMQTPTGDGSTNAGPVFGYVEAAPAGAPSGGVKISVRRNGPYVVEGGAPLVRKSIIYSKHRESQTWRKDADVPADASYRLCRCGHSSNKPFCDGTHARIGFDGTETAPVEASETRRQRFPGTGIALTDDESLCASAAFCHNRHTDVWEMVATEDDTDASFALMHRVEACPSGRLVYEVRGVVNEPDLPVEVGVIKDGPYWVTGGATVAMSDGRTLEVRNRVTLCRCGQSSNKPLCDGTHKDVRFKDG